MKKTLIFLVIFLFSISLVNASESLNIYVENGNSSYTCNTCINPTSAYDSNYSTFARGSSALNKYINVTTIYYNIGSADEVRDLRLQIRLGGEATMPAYFSNVSIPDSCKKVNLSINQYGTAGANTGEKARINVTCLNNISKNEQIYYQNASTYGLEQYLYEEGIFYTLLNVNTTVPIVFLNYSLKDNGFNSNNMTINSRCIDNNIENYTITYNVTLNGNTIVNGTYANNTQITNYTKQTDGTNTLIFNCCNGYNCTGNTKIFTVYTKTLFLIDEKENTAFNLDNVTTARVYFDDNSTYYDFKTNNKTIINFTSTEEEKLRFEFGYSTGEVITRYIDISLSEDENIRVCVNKEGITHYEQLVISASETEVIIKSVFANCLIASDYTRFGYQTSKILKAFSIDTMYYLYTYSSAGEQIILSSLDGSVQSGINIDTLEFNQEGYNIDVLGDGLTFEKEGSTQMKIYYRNLDEDNSAVHVTIKRLDNDTIVLDTTDIDNPNNFTIYFNYATLSGVNSSTVFQIIVDKTDASGDVTTLKKYFNTGASTGLLSGWLAIVINFFLILGGLSITKASTAFSWLGILLMLAGIIFLSLAVSSWYVLFFMGMDAIFLVYIIIIMIGKNQAEIS